MEIIGGIFFVGILTVLLGTLLAILAGGVVLFELRGLNTGKLEFLLKAIAFGYLSAAWIGLLFLVHALFLRPDLETLPRGYALRDDSDAAGGNLLVNLAEQNGGIYGTAEGPDTATDVSRLQIAGRYMLGQADHLDSGVPETGGVFFLLDTHTRHYERYGTEAALAFAAQRLGFALALEPIRSIQFRYAFDSNAQLLMAAGVLPPLALGALGLVQLTRLRRRFRGSERVP